jgi:hypothetical protein
LGLQLFIHLLEGRTLRTQVDAFLVELSHVLVGAGLFGLLRGTVHVLEVVYWTDYDALLLLYQFLFYNVMDVSLFQE